MGRPTPFRTPHLIPILALALAACDAGPGGGLVVVDPVYPDRPFYHDFGALRHGSRAEHRVRLRNLDREPVTFQFASPACTCTVPRALDLIDENGALIEEGDLERAGEILTVPPDGLCEFVLGVNTAMVRPNEHKLAIVRLGSTSRTTPYLTFEIHLVAEKLFTVKPADIRMGEIPRGYGGTAKATIMTGVARSDARLIDIVDTVAGDDWDLTARLDHIFVNGEHVWTLVPTLSENLPLGPKHGKVVLSTTDATGQGDAGRLEVDVWAQVVEDVLLLPRRPHFGVVPEGTEGTLRVALKALVPGTRVRVESARVQGPVAQHLSVAYGPAGYVDDEGRAARWELVLTSDEELGTGIFKGRLVVDLDDEQYPVVETGFEGFVR